jgi:hypothetical protein
VELLMGAFWEVVVFGVQAEHIAATLHRGTRASLSAASAARTPRG